MTLVLAFDQGTTSSRAIVFDEHGVNRGVAQREFTQHFPRPGWVEHDAEEIWSTQAAVATEALGAARATARDIAAIGITNQRETTVIWERSTGRPIAPAIVWQDRRTAEACTRLRMDGVDELVNARAGLLIDPYFSATKIAWLLDNVPGARARAERGELAFGTIDSWLLWKLTDGAVHATDVSNASRTMLFDIHECRWSDELLAAFRVPREILPEVRPTSGDFGTCRSIPALADTPITALVGDQQSALFGQVCLSPGQAKCTYGTGCFLLLTTGEEPRPSHNRLLTTIGWSLGGPCTYALEGSVFIGGALIQWLRDGLGIITKTSEVNELAAKVESSADVMLVPAFAGLGAPWWDPDARGILIGITRGTTTAHIARAALDAIAFQVADLADAMESDAGHAIDRLRVDGGAAASDLLLQAQADLLQRPVERPKVLETTALGAAFLAGLATGAWTSPAALAAIPQVDRTFEPAISAAEAESRRNRWRDAVSRARHWAGAENPGNA